MLKNPCSKMGKLALQLGVCESIGYPSLVQILGVLSIPSRTGHWHVPTYGLDSITIRSTCGWVSLVLRAKDTGKWDKAYFSCGTAIHRGVETCICSIMLLGTRYHVG